MAESQGHSSDLPSTVGRWPMRVSFTKSSIKLFDPGHSVTPLMGHLECMVGCWSVPMGRLHILAYVRLTLAINRIK